MIVWREEGKMEIQSCGKIQKAAAKIGSYFWVVQWGTLE